jgi:hypothetical protein
VPDVWRVTAKAGNTGDMYGRNPETIQADREEINLEEALGAVDDLAVELEALSGNITWAEASLRRCTRVSAPDGGTPRVSLHHDSAAKLTFHSGSRRDGEYKEVVVRALRAFRGLALATYAETDGLNEPPWPGQRYYTVKGGDRVELEELRRTDAALLVKVGALIIVGKRRYTVSAVEDDGDTIVLGPS